MECKKTLLQCTCSAISVDFTKTSRRSRHLYTCISDALPGYHGQGSFSTETVKMFRFQLSCVLFRYVYYFSSVLFHQLFLTYMTTLPNPYANRQFFFRLII